MDGSTVALITTGLTLLVTITGWVFTWRLQNQILERQIRVERNRDSRQMILPGRIEELKELKAWFDVGLKLWLIHNGKNNSASKTEKQSYAEWAGEIIPKFLLAARLEGKPFGKKGTKTLNGLVQLFSECVMQDWEDGSSDGSPNAGILAHEAFKQIDILEERISRRK